MTTATKTQEKMLNIVSDLKAFYNFCRNDLTRCNVELNKIEKFKLDINHEIELMDLNASELAKKTKELKNLLRYRRNLKDLIILYKGFLNSIDSTEIDILENSTNKSIKEISDDRVYNFRLTDEESNTIMNNANEFAKEK